MQSQSHSFLYVDCDIPVGVTVDEWRRRTVRPTRRRLLRKR
jgi:hypothetical protein